MISLGISDRLIKAAIAVALVIVLIIIIIWGAGIFFWGAPGHVISYDFIRQI